MAQKCNWVSVRVHAPICTYKCVRLHVHVCVRARAGADIHSPNNEVHVGDVRADGQGLAIWRG